MDIGVWKAAETHEDFRVPTYAISTSGAISSGNVRNKSRDPRCLIAEGRNASNALIHSCGHWRSFAYKLACLSVYARNSNHINVQLSDIAGTSIFCLRKKILEPHFRISPGVAVSYRYRCPCVKMSTATLFRLLCRGHTC